MGAARQLCLRCIAWVLLAGWGLAAPSLAMANGRPPDTTSLYISPYDSTKWVLGTTFGVAISADCGNSFRWVCEDAVVPGGFGQADYNFVWGPDGEMLIQGSANTNTAISVSRSADGGCTWAQPAGFDGLVILNLTGDPLQPGVAYVPASDVSAQQGALYRTKDMGVTFEKLPLAMATVYWNAVAASRTTPQKLVAVGWSASVHGPYVATSLDQGATWTIQKTQTNWPTDNFSIPLVTLHPTEPNTLLIAAVDNAATPHKTIIFRSTDGGATATAVYNTSDPFRSVHFGADGQTVLVATLFHVVHSNDGGHTFTELLQPVDNACVAQSPNGIVACGNGAKDGFAVASSIDSGASWRNGFLLSELRAKACPAGTPAATLCPEKWAYYASSIGVDINDKSPPAPPLSRTNLGSLCGLAAGVQVAPDAGTITGAPSGSDATEPGAKGGCTCQEAWHPVNYAIIASLSTWVLLRRRLSHRKNRYK